MQCARRNDYFFALELAALGLLFLIAAALNITTLHCDEVGITAARKGVRYQSIINNSQLNNGH